MAFDDATVLTPISPAGLTTTSIATLANADGTNGNKFLVNEGTLLRVVNGSGESITVTVKTNFTRAGLALADAEFAVPASGDVLYKFTGDIDVFRYSKTTLQAWITFSAATSVTVQVIQP